MNDETLMVILYAAVTFAVVVPAVVIAYMAAYRTMVLGNLLSTAFPKKIPLEEGPPPPYHPTRIWRIIFIIAGAAGFGYLLYGVMIQVFAWMPYDWRNEDGIWEAKHAAGLSTLLLYLPVMSWAETLMRKARRCDELEMCEKRVERDIAQAILGRQLLPSEYNEFVVYGGSRDVLCIIYESPPYQEGDDPHGGFPLFRNAFSRRVGPVPHFPFNIHGGTLNDSTTLLTVDGEVTHCNVNFSAASANRNIVERGWGRWVPKGLDITQKGNKLWLLGRAEFAPKMTPEERAEATDSWFDGNSARRVYVPRGQVEAYLRWKQ